MARRKKLSSGEIVVNLGEANPKQLLFYKSRTLYTAYGGAKGGGKTHAIRIKAVGGAIRWPGIRILIIRRTYPELQQNHIEPILKLVPSELATYNGTLHTLYFIDGSMIKFGHYQSATAEQEYQGQEYDWIFMDEATQFTEQEFRYLGGCLRGVNEIPKRFYLTCNPGGVGHQWVKRLFIDRRFKTASANPEENEQPEDYTFIFASVEDNTHLIKSSPAYLSMLSNLPENRRRAYRYGEWDALSGTYFSEFSTARHVIKPFVIPDGYLRYRAFDYGLDMLACCWIAVDETGRCYVYRALKKAGLVVSEASAVIREATLYQEQIAVTYAPPDMWNRQKDSGKTMAELFFSNGVPIIRADSSRVQGHMQIKEMLMDRTDGRPGLLIFDTCRGLIEDIQAILADEANPNDCARQPHDITHSVDALRYFCVSRYLTPEMKIDTRLGQETAEYSMFMTGGELRSGYLYDA
ncbi:phage terminase large subunit [Oscillospiraceae bacterium CM]|nr:phage terminase large subunit [Oscillospiraceae bacterium CM]